jgi:hypothetical protein
MYGNDETTPCTIGAVSTGITEETLGRLDSEVRAALRVAEQSKEAWMVVDPLTSTIA